MNQLLPAAALWLTLTVLAGPVAAQSGAHREFMTDEQGRRFRIGFDQGSRLLIGGGWGARYAGEQGSAALGHFELGVLLRYIVEDERDPVAWKHYHRFLTASTWVRGPKEVPLIRGALYRGQYLRWSADGRITLPTVPPQRSPFPLNIGFDVEVGGVETTTSSSGLPLEVSVLEAGVLFDFLRSRDLGTWLQVGLGPAYGLRIAPAVSHVVAPFTQLTLAGHYEWDLGRQVFDARAEGTYAWSSVAGWGASARASVRYEVIVLAINDGPLSLFGEVDYRYDGLKEGDRHDLTASLGLRLGWPLD